MLVPCDLRVIKPIQIEADGPHYGIFGSTMTCSTTQTLGYPRPWTPRWGGDWQFQLVRAGCTTSSGMRVTYVTHLATTTLTIITLLTLRCGMVTVADVHQQILLRVTHQARHQGPGAQKDASAGPISPESSRISMLYACSPMGSTTSRLPWTAEHGTPCSVLPHFLHTFCRMP